MKPYSAISSGAHVPLNQENREVGLNDGERKSEVLELDENTKRSMGFFWGVNNAILTTFIAAKLPEYFGFWYIPKCIGLLVYRYIDWRPKKMHLFMLDFCYQVNAAFIVFLIAAYFRLLPEWIEQVAFKVLFSFSMGMLAWSIGMFRNSLVFHSNSRITSLFIHVEPPVLTWCMRWFPSNSLIASVDDEMTATLTELYVYPLVVYFVCWLIPYGLWLFFQGAELTQNGYHTLYGSTMKSWKLVQLVVKKCGKYGPFGYCGLHLCGFVLTVSLVPLWFYNFWCHTAFIATMLMVSVWNGSTFYVHKVFEHHEEQFMK